MPRKKKRGRPYKGREKGSTGVYVILSGRSKQILKEWKRLFKRTYAQSIDHCILLQAGHIPD